MYNNCSNTNTINKLNSQKYLDIIKKYKQRAATSANIRLGGVY
jgi:hypothetical protein